LMAKGNGAIATVAAGGRRNYSACPFQTPGVSRRWLASPWKTASTRSRTASIS
jgi:ribosome modulation factor